MEWLLQNWIWIIVAVGVVLLFSRMRHGAMMGGCGHDMAHEGPPPETTKKVAIAVEGSNSVRPSGSVAIVGRITANSRSRSPARRCPRIGR